MDVTVRFGVPVVPAVPGRVQPRYWSNAPRTDTFVLIVTPPLGAKSLLETATCGRPWEFAVDSAFARVCLGDAAVPWLASLPNGDTKIALRTWNTTGSDVVVWLSQSDWDTCIVYTPGAS